MTTPTGAKDGWRFERADAGCFRYFDRFGFAVVENVLDDLAVAALRKAIARTAGAKLAHRRAGSTYGMRNLLNQVPAVRDLASSSAMRKLIEPVLGRNGFAVKATLFDKTPEANWKVAWHQDTTICVRERVEVPGFGGWSVKDGVVNAQAPAVVLSRMMTIRAHLDDCHSDNGALRVIPGSHQAGRLDSEAINQWRAEHPAVLCPVRKGGVLLMRPLTLHASSPAQNPGHRRVIHLEFTADVPARGLDWAVKSCPGTVRAAL